MGRAEVEAEAAGDGQRLRLDGAARQGESWGRGGLRACTRPTTTAPPASTGQVPRSLPCAMSIVREYVATMVGECTFGGVSSRRTPECAS